MSFLNAEQPDVLTALQMFGMRFVWHPSLSTETGEQLRAILEKLLSAEQRVDILLIEGVTIMGPAGTGKYSMFCGRPFKDWVMDLAHVSYYTVAAGTCASFGGVPASGTNPLDAVGLQFLRDKKGGLLGAGYLSSAGFPVINIPGCPAHPDWITESLGLIASGKFDVKDLDKYQRPKIFYKKLAHHACPRNEYYEFKASAFQYSQQGCLFENLGCKATQCESDCNERLWLGRTGSCTRGGFPCLSCTSPRFPDGFVPFFETEKIGDIPTTLPLDVPKAWYVGISGLSKLACPERLRMNAISFKGVDFE